MVRHYSLNSIIYGFKKYGTFSKKELKQLLISTIIIGFIIGFNDKRASTSVDTYFIFFMIFSILSAVLAMLIKMSVQRYFLYKFGYAPQYYYSINSLLIGIVLVFATQGKLWFLAPGYTSANLLQAERLGRWRMGYRLVDQARSLFFGIIFLTFCAIFLNIFSTEKTIFLNHMISIFLAVAFYSTLPLPECDGLYILFGGYRYLWVVTMVFVVTSWILVKLISNFWIILGLSVVVSIIALAIFFLNFGEKGNPGLPQF